MARPGITYDQVASVADAIIGEGQQPTINAVRDRIGTGSPNTIHKHLTAWRAARPQATVAAPELPASLTTAIATEIERAAASARAEIENKLVQAQAEAVELSSVGEALEAERDELFEQVAELTTERDTLAGKAEQQAADIKTQAERIEREQQAAETARVDLAKAQLKIESGTERLVEQTLAKLGITSNQIAAIGRSLNQLVKLAHAGDYPLPDELAALLQETLILTRQASQEIDNIVKTNLSSWESDHA